MPLYPLKFVPILKERIWGGSQLKTKLFKENASQGIGESWELSAVEGSVSFVANGAFKGTSLTELISEFKSQFLGSEVARDFGLNFPVLIKFLDAADDLSIQVHPNDLLAKKRHNSLGKNEMWYVMEAEPNASLIVGFKPGTTSEMYQKHLNEGTLVTLMEKHFISPGDAFYIETGTVHAIGAGTLIAEIQQTSDITYRVYDFNRKDAQGNYRELHTDLAFDAINFSAPTPKKCSYSTQENERNTLLNTPYFKTKYLPIKGNYTEEGRTGESFSAFLCVNGSGEISNPFGSTDFKYGETILVAANSPSLSINSPKGCVLLEVHY